jgi:hypothetical protein
VQVSFKEVHRFVIAYSDALLRGFPALSGRSAANGRILQKKWGCPFEQPHSPW